MNRRNFIGGTLAGFAAARIPVAMDGGQSGMAANPNRRARWMEHGFIDAGGSHEPYIFLVRRGGAGPDIRDAYEKAQSEPVMRRLKAQGVEVFHTHLYKGFGMAAEKAEMEDARRAAEIAHRCGLKVDSYIQWNTMMYETFFAEEPRAKEWIQRDVAGLPILLTYGYQQSFRYRPCFAQQEYLDYLKKIVRFAVEEVKTDFIHFDNFDLNPEPDSCHCPACVLGFRVYLKAKYSPEKRRARFGFQNIDFVNPPQWNRQNPPEQMRIIYDPAIQEWIDYRCQLMADALQQVSLYARSLNSEVANEVNPHGITGANRAWESAIDHARILKWTDAFWTEEENPPGYLADGRLISKIRSFKLARAFDNILLTYIADNPVAMAESLAFNQTMGYVGEDPLQPEMLKSLDFYRKYRNLFLDTEDVATVAVLRSYQSITYNNGRAQLGAVLAEQSLIQGQVPFDLVFDEQLRDLSKYKILVLPESECLSDDQLDFLRQFVMSGGGLVAIRQTGLYDEWRRLRPEPGLRGLADGQASAEAYEENPGAQSTVAAPPSRKEYGKGRVAYLSGLRFDGPMPDSEPYFAISNRFWKRPSNWQEFLDEVRWAAKDDIPLKVQAPEYLVANLVAQYSERRMLVHLINYNARNVPSISSIGVECNLPQGQTARMVKVYTADSEEPAPVRFTMRNSTVSFIVPEFRIYSVVELSW